MKLPFFFISLIILFSFKGDKNKVVLGTHTETCYAVAYSPFSKWIASGSNDNKIFVFDANKKKLEKEWVAHSVGVKDLAFTPKGDFLISAGLDNQIKVWDTENWKLHKVLNGHSNQVLAIAISPDGKKLYSGGDDKKIIIWDLETLKKDGELSGHFDRVLSLDISKNGSFLVSTGGDRIAKSPGNLKIWDLSTNKMVFNLEEETYAIQDAALSDKGTMVFYAGNFQEAYLLKWKENKVAARKKVTEFGINAVLLDGLQTYMASTYTGDIISWKIGGESTVVNSHEKDAMSVALSPDKSLLISGGEDGNVVLTKLVD